MSIAERLSLSSKSKNNNFDENFTSAICFMCLEKGYNMKYLRELDLPSFMVLLDFLEKQMEEQEKQLKKKNKR
jgi:hypothetical protein